MDRICLPVKRFLQDRGAPLPFYEGNKIVSSGSMISQTEYITLKSNGLRQKDICKQYGNKCPVGYASAIEQTTINNDVVTFRHRDYDRKSLEEVKSYVALSKLIQSDRSTARFLGKILGLHISRSESCRVGHRSKQTKLSNSQVSIVTGILLGDGYAKHGRLDIYHCRQQKLYIEYLYRKLFPLFPSGIVEKSANDRHGFRLQSTTHDDVERLEKLFYIDGIKHVPQELPSLIDECGLAIWYMDDGGTSWQKGKPSARIFSMGFDESDHQILRYTFLSKWGIDATLRKHKSGTGLFLAFSQSETNKLFNIIRPHLSSDMIYKVEVV
jgi:hypothetical protein